MKQASQPSPHSEGAGAAGQDGAGEPEATIARLTGIDEAERAHLLAAVARLRSEIADRREVEQALRDSEARYRSMVESSTQFVWRADSQGRLFDRRERWSAMTGVPLDELPDEPLDLVHPEDRERGSRQWWDAVAHGEPLAFEQRVRWSGGEYRYWQVRGAPVRDPDGQVREWIGTDTDITERKRAEAQLQRLNAASLAINSAGARDELLRLVAEEARALIGAHGALALVGGEPPHTARSPARHVPGDQPDLTVLAELVLERGQPVRLPRGVRLPGVTPLAPAEQHAGLLGVPLVGSDGRALGAIALADRYDGEFSVSDEALLQQLAQLAAVALENRTLYEQERAARAHAEEAGRLKDEFLATVSHELRTPLTAFLGYAQMLQTRSGDEAYVARTIEKMVRSARAQAQIIDDLLDVSRIVSGMLRIEPQPIDLIAVVRAALDTVRPAVDAKGIRLEVDLSTAASTVMGDAARLQQVAWNLLSNAVKFTPPGGLVRVRLERRAGEAQLTVIDTGQGIPAAFLPFVFDRFRQADSTSRRVQGGLGLGLAIVRHLVELHGGAVHAASAGDGQGAAFTVWLPLAASEDRSEADAAPWAAGAPTALRGLRVLLVDDQPDLLELLEEVLAQGGALVRSATGAREALELLRDWRPDVLVSDIAMPGEDGYWLVRQIRALPPDAGGATPALALTAYVRLEEQVRVLAAGFQHYLPKPIDPAELIEVVAGLAPGAASSTQRPK